MQDFVSITGVEMFSKSVNLYASVLRKTFLNRPKLSGWIRFPGEQLLSEMDI